MATLDKVLSDMINKAGTTANHSSRITLPNGLHISFVITDNKRKLTLTRKQVWPSASEITIVWKYWPGLFPIEKQVKRVDDPPTKSIIYTWTEEPEQPQ